MPLFTRQVEIGRVVLVTYGPYTGRLAVILDVLDTNRALVDGPSTVTGVPRHILNFKHLQLTDLKIKIGRGARLQSLKKAFEKEEVAKKWAASSWAKKLALRKKRASANDFDRFQVMLARKKRAHLVSEEVRKLKKAFNKKATTDKKPKTVIPRYLH